MLQNITDLSPLSEDEIPRIRDIYIPLTTQGLGLDAAVAFTGGPMARRLFDPTTGAAFEGLWDLAAEVDKHVARKVTRFRIDTPHISFRAQVGRNAHGSDLQLRVLPKIVPLLQELEMPEAWRRLLLDESLFSGGLVLFAAPHGQGKTTTASSVVATRLQRFGGMANTFEDPVELPLQGAWGSGGLCIQRQFDRPCGGTQQSAAMEAAMRQYPAIGSCTMLFIGEITEGNSAVEAMKAAANGHLVVATIHGRDIEAALRRIVVLACGELGSMSEQSVRAMLGEVLRGVVHQRLVWTLGGEGWSAAQIEGDVAWSSDPDSAIANAVRSGSPAELRQELAEQTRLLAEEPAVYLERHGVRSAGLT